MHMTPPTETSETTDLAVPQEMERLKKLVERVHRWHERVEGSLQRPTQPITVTLTLTSYPPYRADVQSISCSGPALSAGAVSYLSALLRAIDTWAASVQTDG